MLSWYINNVHKFKELVSWVKGRNLENISVHLWIIKIHKNHNHNLYFVRVLVSLKHILIFVKVGRQMNILKHVAVNIGRPIFRINQ